jgi:pimeloyl-ACP methyl ester carboxylesterase
MLKRIHLVFVTQLLIIGFTSKAQNTILYGNNPAAGKYTSVNGTQIYYEVYGKGQPLLLLHGNGGSIAGRANIISTYSKNYMVIAVDSRCHGKSGCPTGDLDYEVMATDIFNLLNEINVDSALIWGHSDGGIIGLIMALKYPQKVKKLLATGANIVPDTTALQPELVEMMKMYPMMKDTLMQKRIKLMVNHPNMTFEQLSKIKAPVMLMTGDRDAVKNEHTLKMFKAIPNSQLCIIPGATHFLYEEQPTLFNYYFKNFFEKPFQTPSTVDLARKMAAEMNK